MESALSTETVSLLACKKRMMTDASPDTIEYLGDKRMGQSGSVEIITIVNKEHTLETR